MSAMRPLGATATINASTSSATCANNNTSAPGAYIANRTGNWAFVYPINNNAGAATVPMSTTSPSVVFPVPPLTALSVSHGGGNFGWAAILEPSAGSSTGWVHITPTDGNP